MLVKQFQKLAIWIDDWETTQNNCKFGDGKHYCFTNMN